MKLRSTIQWGAEPFTSQLYPFLSETDDHVRLKLVGTLEADGNKRIEVWSFQAGEFARWRKVVAEQNNIVGEATETGMNLVINGEIFVTDLHRAR